MKGGEENRESLAPLRGKRVVSYHPDLIYFAERFGIEYFGTIESRPGIDPTRAMSPRGSNA